MTDEHKTQSRVKHNHATNPTKSDKPRYFACAKEMERIAQQTAPELDNLAEALLPAFDSRPPLIINPPSDTTGSVQPDPAASSHQTPAAKISAGKPTPPVEFALWESLAYDLALDTTDQNTIARAYKITPAQLNNLHTNPYFVKMVKAKKEEVQRMGAEAAFKVKMKMLANKATTQFLHRLTSHETSTRDFHALFRTAVELAELIPKEQATPLAAQGASITFNIQGVPGLGHLSVATPPLAHAPNNQPDLHVRPTHTAPRTLDHEPFEPTDEPDQPYTVRAVDILSSDDELLEL